LTDSFVPRRARKRRRWPAVTAYAALMAVLALGAAVAWQIHEYWEALKPGTERIEPDFGGNPKPVFHAGTMLEDPAAGSGDGLMLTLETVRQLFDPYLYHEPSTDSVILTTADKVVRMKTDQLTAFVNEEPVQLAFPLTVVDDELYVPLAVLEPYYRFTWIESGKTGAVLLFREGDVLQWARVRPAAAAAGIFPGIGTAGADAVPDVAALRTAADHKAPIALDLADGERVLILGDEGGWYRVQTTDGWIGYVAKNEAVLEAPEVIRGERREDPYVPWKPVGGKINLTWEHVVSRNPDTSAIGDMPGLNVVSPTWFYLADDEGNVGNKASHAYVRWAHERGYQVWALFSNDFDPDRTRAVLSDYDKRMKVIRQLLHYAETYRLQGINIDFENVYMEDGPKLTQFVRELTPWLHEQGLVVSIDVTIRGGSPMWSLFLDRRALGETVDYMAVMTYDQHWASSPVAGSVAELSWTEKGIADIIREDGVPPSKLLLGVPFYTYIWTEEKENGKTKVKSRAVGMTFMNNLIEEKGLVPVFDEKAGQDYVEYEEDGKRIRVWLENEKSMRARMEIVNKYGLAGVASWRRGLESPDIWTVMKETLEKRP